MASTLALRRALSVAIVTAALIPLSAHATPHGAPSMSATDAPAATEAPTVPATEEPTAAPSPPSTMTYELTMDLEAQGKSSGGDDEMHLTWNGKTTLVLKRSATTGCYTASVPGNEMHEEVVGWLLTSKNGDVHYEKPRLFDAPIRYVTLNTCNAAPRLHVVFLDYGPTATIVVKGHEAESEMFAGMMSAAIVGHEVSGKAPEQNASDKGQIDAVKAEIDAHKGDVQWMMGPLGQADVQKLQHLAADMSGQSTSGAAKGHPVAMALQAYDVGVNWNTGAGTAVDQTLGIDHDAASGGGSLTDQLHVMAVLQLSS